MPQNFRYTPFYCEENIWYLCQAPSFQGLDKKVCIISNNKRCCPFWNQKACKSPDQPIWWDYHVILLFRKENWLVWDLDSTLSIPSNLKNYIELTFRWREKSEEWSQPVFRVVDFLEFIKKFTSDRSHMLTANGKWKSPPPNWPPIICKTGIPLTKLIDMRYKAAGSIYKIETLFEKFKS